MVEQSVINKTTQTKKTFRQLLKKDKRIWEWNGNFTYLAMSDLIEGLRRWPLWLRLGWQDIVLRYRRSIIGPFWLTLSMAVMISTLGLLYSGLFKIDTRNYLPYLTTGLLVWNFINGLISEGCQVFIESDWLICQADLPLSMFPLRVVWRNFILFLHNVPVYIAVVIFFQVKVGWEFVLIIPGLIILLANALWCTILFGMLSARFRDLPQIIASILQVTFFVTPILWTIEQSTSRRFIVTGNPFYHLIELLRKPMLGEPILLINWGVSLVILFLGCLGTFFFYRRFHGRIAYWV
ncbi:ABC transporter permease [Desulfobacter postgatei]|uniref:ABC transporter permease n=1 Tax=Desulfobacter postgatei TaxID=2293 RepID=UPI00259B9938|nr:ABC transporter permease [uncultured Desulfobacter sp.]